MKTQSIRNYKLIKKVKKKNKKPHQRRYIDRNKYMKI